MFYKCPVLLLKACLSVGFVAGWPAAWKGGKEKAEGARALLSAGAPGLFTRPRSDSLLVSPAPALGRSLYYTEIFSFPDHLHGTCAMLAVTLAVFILRLSAPALLKGLLYPSILLSATLTAVENSRAKPCCLEFYFSSSHVLSRQTARTNKRLHCRREKSFNNNFKSSSMGVCPYLAIFLQRSSFLRIWRFVYVAIYEV